MARFAFALLFVVVSTSRLHAQSTPIDPPIVGRPVDFSNIVGKYTINVSAAPTLVHVEDSILLKIAIIGSGDAKFEPKRSTLKLIPAAWEHDFYILDMPADDRVMRDEKTWLFTYRLKPKSTAVKAIPLITLSYYDPSQPEKNRFQKAYGGPIPITVTPRPEPAVIEVTDEFVPASFYTRATSEQMLRSTPRYELDAGRLLAWLALPPILCLFAAWLDRRWHPSKSERARRYHHAAAKRALARLGSDSPWQVVAVYLHERFDFPALDGAPCEVATFLKRRGFALALCGQGRAFFERCDAVRFTPAAASADRLAEEAKRLIAALEADPCVR